MRDAWPEPGTRRRLAPSRPVCPTTISCTVLIATAASSDRKGSDRAQVPLTPPLGPPCRSWPLGKVSTPPGWMFKKLFGGGGGSKPGPSGPPPGSGGGSVSKTVNAIQSLGEVRARAASPADRARERALPPPLPARTACSLLPPARAPQTEELLNKRRDLLEKKIAAELERAKQLTKAGNKRGAHERLEGWARLQPWRHHARLLRGWHGWYSPQPGTPAGHAAAARLPLFGCCPGLVAHAPAAPAPTTLLLSPACRACVQRR